MSLQYLSFFATLERKSTIENDYIYWEYNLATNSNTFTSFRTPNMNYMNAILIFIWNTYFGPYLL